MRGSIWQGAISGTVPPGVAEQRSGAAAWGVPSGQLGRIRGLRVLAPLAQLPFLKSDGRGTERSIGEWIIGEVSQHENCVSRPLAKESTGESDEGTGGTGGRADEGTS